MPDVTRGGKKYAHGKEQKAHDAPSTFALGEERNPTTGRVAMRKTSDFPQSGQDFDRTVVFRQTGNTAGANIANV